MTLRIGRDNPVSKATPDRTAHDCLGNGLPHVKSNKMIGIAATRAYIPPSRHRMHVSLDVDIDRTMGSLGRLSEQFPRMAGNMKPPPGLFPTLPVNVLWYSGNRCKEILKIPHQFNPNRCINSKTTKDRR